ncbi:MAG: vitamin B12 dependent-methionine synthase activation domain-containing protein [Planctomycetota bacterium]|jgi:hypothetical protein
MNSTVILQDIPLQLDIDQLIDKLCIADRPTDRETFTKLVHQARTIAHPKAMYKIAYIDSKTDDQVVIEGITLTSHILGVNLKDAHRVFPFVATCGRELYDWSQTIDDILERFWADTIMEEAVRTAFEECKQQIESHLQTGQTSFMEPGSLEDWPVKEQPGLFAILGNPLEAIGVELTDSCLMVPIKSLSGIRFCSEVYFENCQLCPHPKCPGRRSAYDPELLETRYGRNK